METTSLSRREGQVVHEVRSRDIVVFTPRDVARFLGTSRLNAHRIISSMKRKGLVRGVERGKYLLTEAWDELDVYEIVPEVFKPSYIGFWSALHYHGMTDQVPRTVFVATTKRRRPLRMRGQAVRYVTIKARLFFGYERFGKVIVSDREKTVIDCLRHLEHCGGVGQVYEAVSDELDPGRMVDYCVRTRSSSIASRLGYLMERRGLDFEKDRLRAMLKTYTRLDPGGGWSGLEPDWKLYVNRDLP